jgi:hypothetical protein
MRWRAATGWALAGPQAIVINASGSIWSQGEDRNLMDCNAFSRERWGLVQDEVKPKEDWALNGALRRGCIKLAAKARCCPSGTDPNFRHELHAALRKRKPEQPLLAPVLDSCNLAVRQKSS